MKIFYKIFISIALLSVIFTSYFVIFIISNQKEELTNRLNSKITYLREINQNTISHLLFDINKDILITNLNALYLDDEIIRIHLHDYSQTIHFKKEKKHHGQDLIKDKIDLSINNEVFGELTIWYTKDIIKKDIEEFIINIIELSTILLILMFIVIYIFIKKFTNTISKLINASNAIASGNLDHEINIETNDEIGLLANKFDSMRNSLKNRISTIDEQLKFQQLLMESVNTPIYIKNTEGIYIDCNNSFSSFYGKSKEEIIGKTMDSIIKDDYLKEQKEIEQDVLEIGGFRIFEANLPNVNGDIRNLLIYKNTYFDANYKIKWIIGTYFDITEMKKAKNEIVKFNEELQEKVYERTEELEESNEELQASIHNLNMTRDKLVESEKMASLGGLVAGVAHEINTPVGVSVTAVTHFDELIKKLQLDFENNHLSEDKFKEFLETSKELSRLINTNLYKTTHLIKSFKQIAVDQTNESKRKFNLKEYIHETLFSLSSITKKIDLDIKINIDDNIIIDSYPGSFSQIITNFITNSVNHGFENIKKGTICIEAEVNNNELVLTYKDTGKGIEKENLSKIFDPFFTTKRNKGGTGLGLNIIYNIVTTNLKGSIICKSEINKGVEFIITIDKI